MKTFLKHLFVKEWYHKCVAILLAVIIWLAVNHSQSTSKILENVAVRVINISPGSTVEGLLPNGILNKRISLTLHGKKLFLENISSNDIEVVVDGKDKTAESAIMISKKNLFSLNPDVDLSKSITRIMPYHLSVQFVRMVTEKILVRLSLPVGEAPKNYEFIDVWPYTLSLTTSGPEPLIKELKEKGVTLTFNLSLIPKHELDNLPATSTIGTHDEVSFFVPNDWKKVSLPTLSDQPIEINDPRASDLRIDFIREDLHPITRAIPISVFYPPEHRLTFNPEAYGTCAGKFIEKIRGIHYIHTPLYVKGVSKLFLEVVQDMIEISVTLNSKNEKHPLDWSVQFINPSLLEERYLFRLSDLSDEFKKENTDPVAAKTHEEYLRNRFRKYMHQFQLYTSPNKKFDLLIEMKDHSLQFQEM